jgi:phosphoglycolate phosphatase-like HAD superfamily hydrolase
MWRRAYHRRVPVATAVAVDLDGALGDTRQLWDAWLEDAARRLRTPELVDLPADRGAAAAELDPRVGNWPALLERFCEDHAPVYLRPSPEANAALRRLHAAGVKVGAFTDAPEPLARVALAHFGVARRLAAVETGTGALERLLETLGSGARVVRTPAELLEAAA